LPNNQQPQPEVVPPLTGPAPLNIFGFSFFEDARTAVQARRAAATNPGAGATNPNVVSVDGLKEAIGPEGMAGRNVSIPTPERYQVGPGDTLTVRYSSRVTEPKEVDVRIDSRGIVNVPETGRQIVVRGMTLEQFERRIGEEIRLGLRGASVSVTLKALRSISVLITGEVFAPGTYEMPSIVTLFNALYAAGGPSENGSFRNIRLKRANTNRSFDLYRLLINGDSSQDIPLQPGDVIIVPPAESRVIVRGEVRRPAIYELMAGETLRNAVRYAGGAKPSGVTQRISVESVRPGIDRRLIDANLLGKEKSDNPRLYDGDVVEVFSIRPIITNAVQIEGAVDLPRTYAYFKGMRVSDLVEAARGTMPEASLERADLFRRNADGTTSLVVVDLRGALQSNPAANLELRPDDRLVVYRVEDIRFLGDRQVEARGAVRKPGRYERATNMTLRDLLIQAGGLAPSANDQIAFLQRINPDGTPGDLVRVNVGRVIGGEENLVLQDRDVLQVNTVQEAQFLPEQTVEVLGAVQRPGTLVRSSNMRLRDAIELAGNVLPTANVSRVFVQRFNQDGTTGPLVTVDLNRVWANDPTQNIELQPRDRITIYTIQEAGFIPEQRVEVTGAVQKPGTYEKASNMRVADLLALSGGALPTAFRQQVFLQRSNLDGTQGPLLILDLDRVAANDPTQNVELQTNDRLSIFTIDTAQFRAEEVVTINGAVMRPGAYPRAKGMTLRDLIALAGGVQPDAAETIEIGKIWTAIGTPFTRIPLRGVLEGDASGNPALDPGDVVTVPRRTDLMPKPRVVTILGAVRFPGPYMLSGDADRLSNLVKRAGGVNPTGFAEGAEFVRNPTLLRTPRQLELQPRLLETLLLISEDEYKRASALADMDRLRIVFSQGATIGGSGAPALNTLIPGADGTNPQAGTVQPGQTMDQALAAALRSEAVTKARTLGEKELVPSGNLNVDMAAAIRRPGSGQDVTLMDGDIIVVPERPTTVNVTGAVVLPSSVLFEDGKGLQYYIDRSGGVTHDAAINDVLIVRATGALERYKRGVKIKAGDNILVPTKVMATRLTQRQNDLQTIGNLVTSAGITIALIRSLAR
jgi:protein involved in polysaccharide export with SLBB domain